MRATAVRTRPPADEVLTSCAALTEPALRAAVEALPRPLHPMTGYHRARAAAGPDADGSSAGRARDAAIRSALALLSCAVVSGRREPAVPAAVAVELVHDFSLLLDEEADGRMPDRARPHRPTAWTVVGAGPAVLAGDALLTRALEVLAAAPPAAGRLLTGAVQELVDGRAADLALARRGDATPAECLATAGATTGALLGAACALGAMLGGAGPERVRDLDRFGRHLGVALRIGDDLLGIRSAPAAAGRPVSHALRRRRTSLPVVAALASGTPAGRELRDLHDRAGELTGRDLVRAAEMVERGGGRQWCTDRADELLRRALALLPEGPGPAGPAAHLRHVAELVARRDR